MKIRSVSAHEHDSACATFSDDYLSVLHTHPPEKKDDKRGSDEPDRTS